MKTFDKSRINNSRLNVNLNNTSNNKTIIFYRKTSSQKNKTSFYLNKKNLNSPNVLAQNKNISGNKKKTRMRNYTNENTYQSSKMKSINYSRDKSSIEYDDISPEKFNIYKTSVSPFCLKSNNDNENKIYINKKTYKSKNKINNNSKIKNFTLDDCKNKSFTNLNNNNDENNNLILYFKNRNNTINQNFGKKGINFTFKDNNDRNSSDLLNLDVNKNLQRKFFEKENDSYIINSNNDLLLNNYITIDTEYTNNKISNKNKNSDLNTKMIYIKNKDSKYKIKQSDKNIINKNNYLNKGKIIKFKYNGTEFFFRPSHNKTHNNINNSIKAELMIKSSKIIQKWWKKLIFIKIMSILHKFKYFINTIRIAKIKQYFLFIKHKILSINKIIYIQRKWRELLEKKKGNISSIYIKNDTYGCDNSNKKIFYDNFLINTSDLVNTIEDNNLKTINNNITNKKDNCALSDILFGHSYKKKLFHPNISKNTINKTITNSHCFYTKSRYNNILGKIIFLQRKTKNFLKQKYSSDIRKIYLKLFTNKMIEKNLNPLVVSKNALNHFSIKGKLKRYKNFQISNTNLIIENKEKFKPNFYNISKIENFTYKGINKGRYNFSIEKVDKTLISLQHDSKSFKIINNNFQINNIIKKFDDNKMIINNQIVYIPKMQDKCKNFFSIDKNIIIYSIKNENIRIKPPLINDLCFLQKIKLNNNKILKDIIYLQKYYRNYITKKKLLNNKIVLKSNNLVTKTYKDNSLNIKTILRLQTALRLYLSKKKTFYLKPINIQKYITKKYIKKYKLYGFQNFKKNNKLNIITNEIKAKDKMDFNNIDDLFFEKEEEKIININRKESNERNSTYINEGEENRNQIPIKVMQTKLYKNSINYNMDNMINKNIKLNKNKYINIESLPSYNSIKTISEINDINSYDRNLINLNKNKFITIQTLESKDSGSKIKFKDNKINLNNKNSVTTERINFKNNSIGYATETDNNYFYTENDIIRFSFSNGEINCLNNSILRTTTRNYFQFKDYINRRLIKMINLKVKYIMYHINLFIFIQMTIQRIEKNIRIFVFNKIFRRKNNINVYSIIKRHIKIYNEILKDKNNDFRQNDIINLLKDNIYIKYLLFENNNKFLYITNEQEKNLLKANLFINNDKDLIKYFFLYSKIEFQILDEKKYYNLIQFRLIKEPLHNFNILAITKYMDELYYNITHNNICIKCFCKTGEDCASDCNCHIKVNNSLNLINKIKNKISHNKSFNIGNSIKQQNSEISGGINIPKEKRNIKVVIKKVKRGSADIIRYKYNNLEERDEPCSISDIDIFQEMNTGIKSIINKVKINKAFRQFNHNKNKSNIIKLGRIFTEFNDISNIAKKKTDNHLLNNIDSNKYNTLFNNYNHFKINKNESPEKKIYSFVTKKNLFNEK